MRFLMNWRKSVMREKKVGSGLKEIIGIEKEVK